ncbi:MAG: hypothetical protein ACYDCW_10490, partial [Acidithiobacillus ferrivorans]
RGSILQIIFPTLRTDPAGTSLIIRAVSARSRVTVTNPGAVCPVGKHLCAISKVQTPVDKGGLSLVFIPIEIHIDYYVDRLVRQGMAV